MSYNNEKLIELREKIQRKSHLENVLKEIREQIAQLEPEVRKLMSQRYAEQADVDKLEGNGIKAFFTSLSGKKTEKLEKERQEAHEARVKHESAAFQLETLRNDLKKYIDEYNEVRYVEPEYEKAVNEKAEYIKQTGAPVSKQIADFDKQIDEIIGKNNSIREERSGVSNADSRGRRIVSLLNEAERMAKIDATGIGGGRTSYGEMKFEHEKREKLREAEYQISQLSAEVDRINYRLMESNIDTDILNNIGVLAKNADIYLDDIFTNTSVAMKIGKTIGKIESVCVQLGGIINLLNNRISENEAKMNKIKAQRDEIIINAEV